MYAKCKCNMHFWHAENLPELYEYKPLSGKQILK